MDDQESVNIYMTRAEANRIADLLATYGEGDEDENTAENIRYQAKAKQP
jgi:hypothetical protein